VRKIGEGGMGRVYEARHVRLGRTFAVKVLHAHFAGDPDSLARFRREALAVAKLHSIHIAQVVDVHTTKGGQPYLVIEYLDGEDLGLILERKRTLKISEAVVLARQTCRGLQVAHQANVVHRDLKPENIMIVRDGQGRELVKVLDFGIAKNITTDGSLTQTGTVLGTPAYMAPEQARGSTRIDHRADIYAMGAMLYRALTGSMAFNGENPTTTLTQVLNEEPIRPKHLRADLPPELELVIQKAMAKNPKDRYDSMTALEDAIAPFETIDAAPCGGLLDGSSGIRTNALELVQAPTLATTPSSVVMAKSRVQVRYSRTEVVAYTLTLVVWLLSAFTMLTGHLVMTITHKSLDGLGVTLTLLVASTLVLPGLVFWIRHLMQRGWRNSLTMMTHANELRRWVSLPLATYALTAGIWRTCQLLAFRSPRDVNLRELCAWGASLVILLVCGLLVYRSRRSRRS